MTDTNAPELTESELCDLLTEALELLEEDGTETGLDLSATRSFADAGLMTNNEGLVFRTADGSEFQVTIVRSR